MASDGLMTMRQCANMLKTVNNRLDRIEESVVKYLPEEVWKTEIARHHGVPNLLRVCRKYIRSVIETLEEVDG